MIKLQTLQCVEVTSQAQANNGTQCFHDPITNSDYLSYENQLVRNQIWNPLLLLYVFLKTYLY